MKIIPFSHFLSLDSKDEDVERECTLVLRNPPVKQSMTHNRRTQIKVPPKKHCQLPAEDDKTSEK